MQRFLIERLQAIFIAARRRLAQARERRRAWRDAGFTARRLADLDDHALRDIGLYRSDLRAVAVELHGLGEPSYRCSARG